MGSSGETQAGIPALHSPPDLHWQYTHVEVVVIEGINEVVEGTDDMEHEQVAEVEAVTTLIAEALAVLAESRNPPLTVEVAGIVEILVTRGPNARSINQNSGTDQ